MSTKKVAVIIGSLRKDSYNRKIANELIALAPATLDMKIVEIGELPIYNEDLDKTPPAAWVDFRNALDGMDGVLFVTPEYNRSMSAAIKNALDVASRPYGQSKWNGLAGAVVSVSMSTLGGFGANHHLRQSVVFLNILMMQQPEAYIASVQQLFDENGKLIKEDTKQFLKKFIDAYADWVLKIAK